MPVYTYTCIHCGHREDIQRHVDMRDTHTVCAVCADSMLRIWTPPAVRFVGDGFYVNEKGK